MLPPERVLGEMASLGLHATELGPVGYLPPDAVALRALARPPRAARSSAASCQLVLHEAGAGDARAEADAAARSSPRPAPTCSCRGSSDAAWSPRIELDDREWERLMRPPGRDRRDRRVARPQPRPAPSRGHAGGDRRRRRARPRRQRRRLVLRHRPPLDRRDGPRRLRPRQRRRASSTCTSRTSTAPWRQRVRAGELSLVAATQAGLFRPLGQGDSRHRGGRPPPRPPRVRALARPRAGHRDHRAGAPGGRRPHRSMSGRASRISTTWLHRGGGSRPHEAFAAHRSHAVAGALRRRRRRLRRGRRQHGRHGIRRARTTSP